MSEAVIDPSVLEKECSPGTPLQVRFIPFMIMCNITTVPLMGTLVLFFFRCRICTFFPVQSPFSNFFYSSFELYKSSAITTQLTGILYSYKIVDLACIRLKHVYTQCGGYLSFVVVDGSHPKTLTRCAWC